MTTETKRAEKISPIDQALLDTMETLKKRDARLEKLLPEGVDRSRFNEELRFALAQSPSLLSCSRESLVLAVMRAARTGLPPDGAGGMGYIVPYGKVATFVPGYKGLVFLARLSGLVEDMQPVLVRERDTFEVEEGDNPRIIHKPFIPRKADDSAGPVLAAYTRVLLPSGQRVIKGLLYLPDLARIEASSAAKGGPRSGPHREEMTKKDTLKNAFKSLGVPAGDAFRRLRLALDADNAAETGVASPELSEMERLAEQNANERLRKRMGVPVTEAMGEAAAAEPSPEEQEWIRQQEEAAAKQ